MKKQLTNNYKDILFECYKSDEDLLNKYHVLAPASLEQCVDRTYNDMLKFDSSFKFFKLEDNNGDLVGYFGKEIYQGNNYISGFFILPKYRNKETVKNFWNIVKEECNNGSFLSIIYKHNTRASNFLSKNDMKLLKEVNVEDKIAQVFVFGVGE